MPARRSSLALDRQARWRRYWRLLLLLGDLLALLVFVYIGERDHGTIDAAHPIWGVLSVSAPFVLVWLLAGWWLGAFRWEDDLTLSRFLARSLHVWLLAAPLAVLLRALLLGRAVIPTSFMLATLGFGGLFVLGWRLVFALIWRKAVPKSGGST